MARNLWSVCTKSLLMLFLASLCSENQALARGAAPLSSRVHPVSEVPPPRISQESSLERCSLEVCPSQSSCVVSSSDRRVDCPALSIDALSEIKPYSTAGASDSAIERSILLAGSRFCPQPLSPHSTLIDWSVDVEGSVPPVQAASELSLVRVKTLSPSNMTFIRLHRVKKAQLKEAILQCVETPQKVSLPVNTGRSSPTQPSSPSPSSPLRGGAPFDEFIDATIRFIETNRIDLYAELNAAVSTNGCFGNGLYVPMGSVRNSQVLPISLFLYYDLDNSPHISLLSKAFQCEGGSSLHDLFDDSFDGSPIKQQYSPTTQRSPPITAGVEKRLHLGVDYDDPTLVLADLRLRPQAGSGTLTRRAPKFFSDDQIEKTQREISIQGEFTDQVGVANAPIAYAKYASSSGRGGEKMIMLQRLYQKDLSELIVESASEVGLAQDVERFLSLSISMTQGLTGIHQKRIVHGDIKPENIFVNGDQGFIGDFGSARRLGPDTFSDTTGTVIYFSPEIARSTGEEKIQYMLSNDVWALGLTLWELYHQKRIVHKFRGKKDFMVHPLISKVKDVEGINEVYGIDYTTEPHEGTVDWILYHMLRPQSVDRWNAEEAMHAFKRLAVDLRLRQTIALEELDL